MKFDALLDQVKSLGADEQRKLMACLVALEDQRQPDYQKELARRMDDRSPDRWFTIEQAERELGLASDKE
jgi:hypothetical protein